MAKRVKVITTKKMKRKIQKETPEEHCVFFVVFFFTILLNGLQRKVIIPFVMVKVVVSIVLSPRLLLKPKRLNEMVYNFKANSLQRLSLQSVVQFVLLSQASSIKFHTYADIFENVAFSLNFGLPFPRKQSLMSKRRFWKMPSKMEIFIN